MAVTIAILTGSAGSVLAGLLIPAIVTQPFELSLAYSWQVPSWLCVLAVSVFLVAEEPAVPPSPAARLQRVRVHPSSPSTRHPRTTHPPTHLNPTRFTPTPQIKFVKTQEALKAMSARDAFHASVGVVWENTLTLFADANFMALVLSVSILAGAPHAGIAPIFVSSGRRAAPNAAWHRRR